MEASYALDLRLDLSRFKAKHGDAPLSYKVSEKERYNSYRYLNKVEHATRLNLLLFTLGRDRHAVPSDLAEPLRDFIPEPRDAEIKALLEPMEEEGLVVRLTENDSLAELTAMLHLAEQG